jgi:hypothetical protein
MKPPAENVRQALAAGLAEQEGIAGDEALSRVDDVWQRGADSPYAVQLVPVLGAIALPVFSELKVALESPDPFAPEAWVVVAAAMAAVIPECEERAS